ncbi:MAG: DUF4249 family protein [Gemmatimonadota bacterium]
MRRPWIPAIVAAWATAATGCELTTVEVTEAEEVVVAEVYLEAGATVQEAFLYTAFSGAGADATGPVDGADVRIVDPDGGTLRLEPVPRERCADSDSEAAAGLAGSCYASPESASSEPFVRAGLRYELEITLPDGRSLAGTTDVPGAFEIVDPAPPLCAVDSAYALSWTTAAGAWSYQAVAAFTDLRPGLEALGVEDPPDTLDLLGLAVGADTTITFPGEFGVFDRFTLERDLLLALQERLPAGAQARVVVAAGDRNYVNWVRGGTFNPSGQVRVPSIRGDGTGVFASLVSRERTLVTSEDESAPSCE